MAVDDGSRQPGVLAAGGVVARRWVIDDVDELTAVVRDSLDHLRPWMPWAHPAYGEADSRGFITRDHGAEWSFAVTVGGRIIGGVGLHDRVGPDGREIGYWISRPQARRGRTSLAAALVTEAAFAVLDVDRVEIHHDRGNVASRGVPARLGYRWVGTQERPPAAPAERGIDDVWAIGRDAWPRSAGARLLEAARLEGA